MSRDSGPSKASGHKTAVSVSSFISFHEYLRRRHLQPADGIVICFMEAQQAAIQFCERTRVDYVSHSLDTRLSVKWEEWKRDMLTAGHAGDLMQLFALRNDWRQHAQ